MFQVKSVYTRKDMANLLYVWSAKRSKLGDKVRFLRLLFVLCGLVMLTAGETCLLFGGGGWYILGGLALLLLGVALVLRNVYAVQSIFMWRRYPFPGQPVTYVFRQEDYSEENPQGVATYGYGSMRAVYDYAGAYFLFFEDNQAHILPKSNFSSGSSELFAGFIREKTGQAIRRLKQPKIVI